MKILRSKISKRSAMRWGGISAAGLAAIAASGAAAAPAAPEVVIGQFSGREPSEIDISADGGNIVTGIRWASWTATSATGTGRSAIESCVPDCAEGPVRYVPTTLTLSAPANGRFTRLTEHRAGRVFVLTSPAFWPLAAS